MIVAGEAAGGMSDIDEKLRCPTCKSLDTVAVIDSVTGKQTKQNGAWLADCRACGECFQQSRVEAAYLADALPLGATIMEDAACFECRYNLRTRRTGSACPECGVTIPRMVRVLHNLDYARVQTAFIANTLIYILVLAACVAMQFFLPHRYVTNGLIWIGFSAAMVAAGFFQTKSSRFVMQSSLDWYWETPWARVHGVMLLFFGMLLMMLAMTIFLGSWVWGR